MRRIAAAACAAVPQSRATGPGRAEEHCQEDNENRTTRSTTTLHCCTPAHRVPLSITARPRLIAASRRRGSARSLYGILDFCLMTAQTLAGAERGGPLLSTPKESSTSWPHRRLGSVPSALRVSTHTHWNAAPAPPAPSDPRGWGRAASDCAAQAKAPRGGWIPARPHPVGTHGGPRLQGNALRQQCQHVL